MTFPFYFCFLPFYFIRLQTEFRHFANRLSSLRETFSSSSGSSNILNRPRTVAYRGSSEIDHRQIDEIAQILVKSVQQRAAAGQDNSAVVDVRRHFRTKFGQSVADDLCDAADDAFDDRINFAHRNFDRPRASRLHIAPANREGFFQYLRAEMSKQIRVLTAFGRFFADLQTAMTAQMICQSRIYLVAADAFRARMNDISFGDDGDIGRSRADVNDRRSAFVTRRTPAPNAAAKPSSII